MGVLIRLALVFCTALIPLAMGNLCILHSFACFWVVVCL